MAGPFPNMSWSSFKLWVEEQGVREYDLVGEISFLDDEAHRVRIEKTAAGSAIFHIEPVIEGDDD